MSKDKKDKKDKKKRKDTHLSSKDSKENEVVREFFKRLEDLKFIDNMKCTEDEIDTRQDKIELAKEKYFKEKEIKMKEVGSYNNIAIDSILILLINIGLFVITTNLLVNANEDIVKYIVMCVSLSMSFLYILKKIYRFNHCSGVTVRHDNFIVTDNWQIYTDDSEVIIDGDKIEFNGYYILLIEDYDLEVSLTKKQYRSLIDIDSDIIVLDIDKMTREGKVNSV